MRHLFCLFFFLLVCYLNGGSAIGGTPLDSQLSERCNRLFNEISAISTCKTFLNINVQPITDLDLREKISQMVYGKSAAKSDLDISRRQLEQKEEIKAEEVRIKESQCGRLFGNAEELDACNTLSMLTMRVRTDIQMIDAVKERLGKPAIKGAERQAIIEAEGERQEAFASAQRERDKLEAAKKAKRDAELAIQRAIQEKNMKLPIPRNWKAFEASTNPEDVRLVVAIKKSNWWEACRDFGVEERRRREGRRLAALREFLLDENLINDVDLANTRERKVVVGMTACGVYASLGLPNNINQTTTARSTTAQLVYRDRRMYVYTEAGSHNGNGIVRTIQH
jgi:hypothetical protein